MKEYFYEQYPELFHDNQGRYLAGLANLFGAHLCGGYPETQEHIFVDNKCTVCGIQVKEQA